MNNYITSISCMNDKVQIKDIFTTDPHEKLHTQSELKKKKKSCRC